MSGRLTAASIALIVLVTGAIPAVAGYRCIATGLPMAAQSECCRQRQEPSTPVLKAPCCRAYAAPQLEARRTPPSPETMHAPAPVAWIVVLPAAPLPVSIATSPATGARGRPPGERLQRFSAILRV